MTDSLEVAVTSECSGQSWSVSVWDIHTGSQLMAYKGGGVCAANALSFVGSDYLVAAEMSKPLLNVWPVNSSEPSHELRTVCPGIIGALAISPDGKFLVASISEKIHVWQIESGKLMGVAARHYQPVTCIRFLLDGSHFVSGGDDGMVIVWCISRHVALEGVRLDTVHSFSDHYLPVKDVFIGNGNGKARIFSVSLDGSCRVYDFASGTLLLSLVLDSANLTSVTADVLESSLFLGCKTGDILNVSLRNPPRHQEYHLSEEEKDAVFKGHTKAVTALSPSQDAVSLLSGSADETVRLWHIESKQCLRIIQHKGSVNNAFITFIPNQMFAEKLKISTVMHRLQRGNYVTESDDFHLDVLTNRDFNESSPFKFGFESDCSLELMSNFSYSSASSEDIAAKNKEIDMLKHKNAQLFRYASEKILRDCTSIDSTSTVPRLIDVNIALQKAEQKSFDLEPNYKLGKKAKKRKVSA